MKTSFILIVALLLNTTLLFAEPLSALIKGVNPLFFVLIEGMLVLGYIVNKWFKNLNEACMIDYGHLNIFVVKSPER
jgi:hypothetical protein